MGVTVEQSNDQTLGKSRSLGGVHCIGNSLVESAYGCIDVLTHWQCVPQAVDVAHLQNLAPRFGAFENVARITAFAALPPH
jgi:hypothetical protein